MHHPGFREDTTETLLILQQGPRKGDFLIPQSTSGRVPTVESDSPATDRGQSFVLMLFLWAWRRGREVGERQHPPTRGSARIRGRRLGFWHRSVSFQCGIRLWGSEVCVSLCFYLLIYFAFRWAQDSVLPRIPGGTPSTRMTWLGIYSGKRPWPSLSLLQAKHFSLSTGKFFQ